MDKIGKERPYILNCPKCHSNVMVVDDGLVQCIKCEALFKIEMSEVKNNGC